MLKRCESIVCRISKLFDILAGWGIVAVMALTVSNILLRLLIKSPILGTYEYVGFLTAVAIGFSLAYCAVQNGHIAVSFVLERFSPIIQAGVDVITGFIAFIFLSLSTWHMGKYAYSMIVSGEVSPTTKTIFYPFIYLVAVGLFMLSLVVLIRLAGFMKRGVKV